MPGRWSEPRPTSTHTHDHDHDRSPGASRRPCLYETVLREAIATQHGLTTPERLDLRTCEECGKAYLLTSVWQPHSEPGEIACPDCGAYAIAWEGAHGYIAYWQREGALSARRPRSTVRPSR